MIDDNVARVVWQHLGERLIAEGMLKFEQLRYEGGPEMSLALTGPGKNTIEMTINAGDYRCRVIYHDATVEADIVNPEIQFTSLTDKVRT